jgi:hypothetical protein
MVSTTSRRRQQSLGEAGPAERQIGVSGVSEAQYRSPSLSASEINSLRTGWT